MDFKPIITYSGDLSLFRSLEQHIVTAIPNDTCEWKRSYGRPVKNVKVETKFQTFDTKLLELYKNGEWSILENPVLHIYVTECTDVESYKSIVKDEIHNWLKILQSYDITDWMILLVETLDVKKSKNILARTTVLDKIRLDFASKHGDKCISLINPLKFEQKSTESFRCLLQRIRHLLLMGYNRNITKYEELIRTNREKRTQDGWSFINYFLLQEQLAFVLEILGLHSEALVQYDELDAMFSQFILNSVFGDKQKWLQSFEKPFTEFHGITMKKNEMIQVRKKIEESSATLLEFRSYLFERQSTLLAGACRPWEVAERLLPFLFATLREINALKIETLEGSLACWEFVCALEVLRICDDVSESEEIHKCFQYTAPIWNLAKDKLYELGKLCGLLPGCTPTSKQLHTVVELSAGIGDSVLIVKMDQDVRSHSPSRIPKKASTERLKEALGSNEKFQKLYLELSELAISTYKHVSRLRSARLVGLDLGNFYCTLNEPNKAVGFFTDLLRELKAENWNYLASQTLLELANCYRKMDDIVSYTKTCSSISCCLDLEMLVRTFYFDEFLKSLKQLESENTVAILEDHLKIIGIELINETPIIQDNFLMAEIKLESNFPREIISERISLSFEIFSKNLLTNLAIIELNSQRLPMSIHLDYKQDNTLSCASVVCDTKGKQPLRRSSSTRRKTSPTIRSDFTNNIFIENFVIKPGTNLIQVKGKATRVGDWNFKQLSIQLNKLDFLSENLPNKINSFEVTTKPSSALLNYMNLVAGLEQSIKLIISGGSFIFPVFPKESVISFKCSKNLKVRLTKIDEEKDEFQRELKIDLSNFKSFEEKTIQLDAICELPGRREEKQIEQKVALQCPWSRTEIQIPLHFQPALIASCRLHSSGTQKFLQVVIKGICESKMCLSNAAMKCASQGVELRDINPISQNDTVIYKNLTISYLYEIQVEPLKTENELPTIQVDFTMQYADFMKPAIKRNYQCTFDVTDYTTLFRIQASIGLSVAGGVGTELCRVGSVCHLNLKITKVQENPFIDLMYEVLGDQNMWAVCGRSAGVVSMQDIESHSFQLEVLPLSAGFLPLPNIRLSKYISANKAKLEVHPKLHPFPPGQVYNSTKSMQIHVLASSNAE